jgi:toxin ParE1/3/4
VNCFRLSQQAEQDLEDIWLYLRQKDDLLADQQIAQILNKFPLLSRFPDLGRRRDELGNGLRSFSIHPYVVFYRKNNDQIEIIRILHQSRDVKK